MRHNKSWDSLCTDSIEKEKREIALRYGIRFGQSEIYCISCGRRVANSLEYPCCDIEFEKESGTHFLIAEKTKFKSMKVKGLCSVCGMEILDNIDQGKIITCARCIQALLTATGESRVAYRDRFILEGRLEAARSIESFVTPEEVTNEPSRKFRSSVVRERPVREVRPAYGKRPLSHNRVLDQRRAEIH